MLDFVLLVSSRVILALLDQSKSGEYLGYFADLQRPEKITKQLWIKTKSVIFTGPRYS